MDGGGWHNTHAVQAFFLIRSNGSGKGGSMPKLIWRLAQVAFCAVAFASPGSAQDINQQAQRDTTQPGRFVIAFSSHVRGDTFLLDTTTGEVWRMAEFSNLKGDPMAWQPMLKVGTPADYEEMVRVYGTKPPEPQKLKPQ
jgi:hypothetical protein